MIVFVDTNVLISYLLGPRRDSAPSVAVRAGLQGSFRLLVSREILEELRRSITAKPFLRARIDLSSLDEFERILAETAKILEPIETPPVDLIRDDADTFVLVQALAANADYILTGDQDLLVLGSIGRIPIVHPADFMTMLDRRDP